MVILSPQIKALLGDFKKFWKEFSSFTLSHLHLQFNRFETRKGIFVTALYKQRGKLAYKLIHSGMAGLTAFGVMIAPVVAQEFPGKEIDPWDIQTSASVLSASSEDPEVITSIANKDYRDKIIEYTVADGDTVSTIAEKFGVSTDTIRWQNNLPSKDAIKLGQVLEILPVSGIAHKVLKGDTVDSVGKKYGLEDAEIQKIVSFPFNTFENDETFKLSIGQVLIVPDGVKKDEVQWQPVARTKQVTPDAGTVVASGSFVWPTAGTITQRFAWYHRAIDIANRASPAVLAADSGRVIESGWSSMGYGNHVVIDHGNGYKTLYAHMSRLYVVVGQTVSRGSQIGVMGTTGRSTGIHLHFEVIKSGVHLNPLSVLR